jgi:hypothetical protein
MQIVAVVLLTLGVILAAWSDAQAKVDIPSPNLYYAYANKESRL